VIEALMMERLSESSACKPTRSGCSSAEIVIIGIEPNGVALSMELSPTLEERLPILVQIVLGELSGPEPSARL
jgi:hypothetical protein